MWCNENYELHCYYLFQYVRKIKRNGVSLDGFHFMASPWQSALNKTTTRSWTEPKIRFIHKNHIFTQFFYSLSREEQLHIYNKWEEQNLKLNGVSITVHIYFVNDCCKKDDTLEDCLKEWLTNTKCRHSVASA